MAKQIQHRSMRGKIVDMDLLRKRNELTPAIGNARVNARGDALGPGGKIVKKREEMVREYYEKNPNAVRDETGNFAKKRAEAKAAVQPVTEETKTTRSTRTTKKVEEPTVEEQAMLDEFDEGWEEDADGNFVKKGE
jgi:predicted transcriptional regulator